MFFIKNVHVKFIRVFIFFGFKVAGYKFVLYSVLHYSINVPCDIMLNAIYLVVIGLGGNAEYFGA